MGSSGKNAGKFSLPFRSRIFLGLLFLLVVMVGLMVFCERFDLTTSWLIILCLVVGTPLAFTISSWIAAPFKHGLTVINTAARSYADGDFGIRLPPPKQPELYAVSEFYNLLAEMASEERSEIYQKELLLDTLVQSTPMTILLVGAHDRIILANNEARQMFAGGNLVGQKLEDLLEGAPDRLKQVLEQDTDVLFTLSSTLEIETYHLSQRRFRINTLPHRLIMIRRLTREMNRQEVESWKKLIRLINHELNNTLAPIQSLLHSARTILQVPEQHHKLDRIFQTMEGVTQNLHHFLEDYAAFARLPMPQKEKVDWSNFLEQLQVLMPFQLENRLSVSMGWFDPGQIQQVLLNLLKNAKEASGQAIPVEVLAANTGDSGVLIQIKDRGKGMKPEALEKALLPFFSTKKTGTGLGLPLCREILESHGGSIRIQNRQGGGITVSCLLPGQG